MPRQKMEHFEVDFPAAMRVSEKLAILADKKGQSVSVLLRHIIDDALAEYDMTLYDHRVRRGNAHMGAACEAPVKITLNLTDDEQKMLLDAIELNDAYGPADYITLVLDQSYDKYELRAAYREYAKVDLARRKAKVQRSNKLILQLDQQRFARYKKMAQQVTNGMLGEYIMTLIYYDNRGLIVQ